MAEWVLFTVADGILSKLVSLAFQEIGLWWGLQDELDKLKNTISRIRAVLLDAEKKQTMNEQVKDWFGKLKEVVYDVDDLLDEITTEALRRRVMDGNKTHKEGTCFLLRSNQLAYDFKMGRKIKATRKNWLRLKLIDNLSEREEYVSIISIVGMGGLGKTTLAQLIFNDEKVKSHFELKMWVCVTDTFELKTIVQKILESATKRKPESLELDT
ncbi:hypothetical protein GH714_017572 [Hevea brasiliensis]|uniref:Rx N-terminal domain-containing protein n=1 Tax=Hevea brasiliensis TaxID=3981 RepID=A0A6A6N0J2_HEVBR|nr:hypothetical protein GH714_017572 [Hevea brasiliensis]